jgi:predicted AlkP superfamily phosphohydrolase/phosphomutase
MGIIAVVAFVVLVALATVADSTAQAPERGRLLILGFDGADHGIVDEMMANGELPNLAALAAEGSYQPLLPTNPAQTPVSWATFSTGLNPGRTQIMDFLKRPAQTYTADMSMTADGLEPFRVFGLRGQAFGLAAGTVVGALLAILFMVVRRLRRGRRPVQTLRHGAGALTALLVFVVAMVGGIAGSSLSSRVLPRERSVAINPRIGTPFWEIAADQGVRARIVRVPVTFPAVPIAAGEVLSGLGVPDIRGLVGKPSLYTTDPRLRAGDSRLTVEIIKPDPREDPMEAEILGPANQMLVGSRRSPQSLTADLPAIINLPMSITWIPEEAAVELDLPNGGQVRLHVGEWSNWQTFTFPSNSFLRVRGIGRFYLHSVTPDLNLYLSPINFHPAESKTLGFTAPANLGSRLAERFGLYKTMGWALDTWTISDKLLDEKYFLDDVQLTVEQYRRMMRGWLEGDDWDLHVQVFMFTDRVAHVLWRFIDPEHPLHDAVLAEQYGDAIRQTYLTMDEIVGEAREQLAPEDRLMVISDHGFASYRYSFNINTWLLQNGYMTLREGVPGPGEQGFSGSTLFADVDWSKTRAYALGLGAIYLNVAGREPLGIVRPGDEYDTLAAEITSAMESWEDPVTGLQPVHRVYGRQQMYRLYDPLVTPDLRAANRAPFRVGWQDTLGGLEASVVTVNTSNWSADHASSDPELVKGILFSSIRDLRGDAYIGDMGPTILELLGVPVPDGLDGTSLLQAR